MKAPIRAVLLASALTFTIAAPAFADAPTITHETVSTCRTDDETGLTSCFESEATIRTKETKTGASRVRIEGTIHSTVVDSSGNLVSSFDSTATERDVMLVADEGLIVVDVNIQRQDETTEGGVTTCTRYRVLIKHEIERINEVTTTPGPC